MDASFENFPEEIIQEIAMKADWGTIKSMRMTNRRVNSALSDTNFWIDRCHRDNVALPTREFRKSLSEHNRKEQENESESSTTPDYISQTTLDYISQTLNESNEKRDESDQDSIISQTPSSPECSTSPATFMKWNLLKRKHELNYMRIWLKNPFRSNIVPPMLKTLDENSRKYGWRFQSVDIEEPPQGIDPHPDIPRCFVTSHRPGIKVVEIDLVDEGIPEWVLDHVRPSIIVTEMVAPRFDCASEYAMHAQLLRDDEYNWFFNPSSQSYRKKVVQRKWPQFAKPAYWEQVEIKFDNYKSGIRKIGVFSQGEDLQFWAGNYGAKFANLKIRVEMPAKFEWISDIMCNCEMNSPPLIVMARPERSGLSKGQVEYALGREIVRRKERAAENWKKRHTVKRHRTPSPIH